MDWKKILGNMKLIDFQTSLKGKQVGVVNVTVNNYHLNIDMPENLKTKFANLDIDEAIERKVKEETTKLIEPIGSAMDFLPESTVASVVASTMATATLNITVPLPKNIIKGHEEEQ